MRVLALSRPIGGALPRPRAAAWRPRAATSAEAAAATRPDASFGISAAQLRALVEAAAAEGRSSGPSTPAGAALLASQLRTSLTDGLLDDEAAAAARRAAFGDNAVEETPAASFASLLLEALLDPTILALIAAGCLSLALSLGLGRGGEGEWIEGAAVLASVVVVTTVSAASNWKSNSKFRELNRLKAEAEVRVVRGGAERRVSARALLAGDVLRVEGGDVLEADALLLRGSELKARRAPPSLFERSLAAR